MSSYTSKPFMLYQAECRVTLDNLFCCTRSIVELHSTALSSVPGPMSSFTSQPFMLYQVECRLTRQPFLLYQVQRRVTLDSPFFCTRSSVELKSTRYLVYRVLRSSKLLRSNGCFWNPNINRLSGKIWTRLSELTLTIWTAGRSCWLSRNLDAERGNEECGILSLRNLTNFPVM